MKVLVRGAMLAAAVWVAGCNLFTGAEEDPARCNQTYEFSNFGCARMVVIYQPPPRPWPQQGYRWDVRVRTAREGTGADAVVAQAPDSLGTALKLIRWEPPEPGSQDTSSVWVIARLLEDTRAVNVPLPDFAADSVLHVARFAPVGSRPPVDTIRLTLEVRP
jgi:hypothetical protein